MLSLLTALVLAFSLAACGVQGNSSGAAPEVASGSIPLSPVSDDQPQALPREPVGDPAVISYPELAGETLVSSALYRQALARPSVILFQDEVLTDPQPVRDFLDAVEKGEERDLYLYFFRYWEGYEEPYRCSYSHFTMANGALTCRGAYENSWDSLEEGGASTVTSISLNEYGFLIYHLEGCSEPTGVRVVNDRDLYDDAEERQRLDDTYLRPLSNVALMGCSWSSVEEMSDQVNLVWLFEDIYCYENENDPWERFGSRWPLEEMTAALSRYFEGTITPEMVVGRKYADAYDPATNTVFYEGGRGGMSPSFRVTGWEQDGDLLKLDYETCDPYTNAPVEGSLYTLTVRLMEDGSFRYRSNLPRS